MAPKKLSDSEKQDIVELYREPAETTTTLSERFGVSNSTISRILKGALDKDEYDALVQQKRAKGAASSSNQTADDSAESDSGTSDSGPSDTIESGKPKPIIKSAKSGQGKSSPVEEVEAELDANVNADVDANSAIADQAEPSAAELSESEEEADRRARKRSSAKPVTKSDRIRAQAEQAVAEKIGQQLQLLDAAFRDETPLAIPETADPVVLDAPESLSVTDLDDEDDEDDFDDELEDDLDDDIDDLDDDFDDDDEDDEDDDDDFDVGILDSTAARDRILIEILPFEDADLPRTCYLVVDRFAELITRPLREFGHLGQIPEAEVQEMTLPVFDNHRVARRFSRRNQRVIKVPDGTMLEKTSDYLQAKGITRLLIDGQIYALD